MGYSAGLQVWIYGLALLRTEQFRRLMSALDGPVESMPFAPINQIGHMRMIPDASSNLPFTPNVDTLYSGSVVELDSNQPYLGTRATGRDAGAWMIVAPSWQGEVPDGLTLYRSESNTITIALRIRIEGPEHTEAGCWPSMGSA